MPANPEIERYIYEAAVKRGIAPEVAVEVARREALNVFDPNKPDLGGDDRSSFGPFQLHYGGRSKAMPNAGLGDEFTAATGLRADDPSTWRQQVDFSLDYAKKHGWGSWMGAKAAGITGMAGIDGRPATGMVASANGGSPAPSSTAEAEPDFAQPVLFDFPQQSLADDLSGSVVAPASPTVSRGDTGLASAFPVSDGGGFTPPPEFASAIPETPPPAPVTTPAGPAADISSSPLADIFKVADIGQATATDPVTGLPVLPRPWRSIG